MSCPQSATHFHWQPWLQPIPAQHRAVIATWAAEYPASLPGDGLKLLRECGGFTRRELAGHLSVHDSRIGRWERGAAGTDAIADRMLRHIYLGISIKDINARLELTENWPQWVRFELRSFGWQAVKHSRELQPDKEKAPRRTKAPRLRLVKKVA